MQPFPGVMRNMSRRDRSVLGGLVLAMIVGVGGSLALAASCLGRDNAHRADDDTMTSYPEDRSAKTSSGGVPGEEAVGTTQITSVELPAGAPASTATNAPPPTPAPPAQPPPAPAPTANTTVNVNVNGDKVSSTTSAQPAQPMSTNASDNGTASGSPNATTSNGSNADGGATNEAPASARDGGSTSNAAPTATATATQRFTTDSPPYGASSWTANHDAGAGPFTTERNVPDNPGP